MFCLFQISVLTDVVCDLFKELSKITTALCRGYSTGAQTICAVPQFVNDGVTIVVDEIGDITDQFTTDIDFTAFYDSRGNQSSTFESIQQAIEDDVNDALVVVEHFISILDKLLALSVVYLLFKTHMYHTAYRTKDKFDNFYITEQFKILDDERKKKGKKTLLPLKKSEKVRLIDVTSFRLSKPEKGLFKLGLVTLVSHICIASILILVDNGLYWLLQVIRKHGSIQVDLSGESRVQLEISGESALSAFISEIFGDGFGYNTDFDVSYDNTRCLPVGSEPNHALAAGIGICYIIAIFMVLFQAYALRLRRRIAAYFYPERELERLYFIYTDTLRKRQTLFKFLKDAIKQKKKENDLTQKVSLRIYLADRYPTLKKIFKILHITSETKMCFGCDSEDDGKLRQCEGIKCTGLYCEECLNVMNNSCSICGEKFSNEEIYATIEDGV